MTEKGKYAFLLKLLRNTSCGNAVPINPDDFLLLDRQLDAWNEH